MIFHKSSVEIYVLVGNKLILVQHFAGIGLSLIRSSLFAILPYHFENENLDMAMATVYVGLSSGWLIITVPVSFLFEKFGFSKAMLLVAPWMLVHLLGVVFYSQDERIFIKKSSSKSQQTLKESLKEVLSDTKVLVLIISAPGFHAHQLPASQNTL